MEKISILAITKNGIKIGLKIKKNFCGWKIYAPIKLSDKNSNITWYNVSTRQIIVRLFNDSEGIVCLFSLGAIIRLVATCIKNKNVDPAIIAIDDKSKFVISVLSGHIGGANKLTNEIAKKLNSIPVITTAADVNNTISIDMIGKELGWKIDNELTVTKVSALMVNKEKIGIYQDSGNTNWWNKKLPNNVKIYTTINGIINSKSKGFIIISDQLLRINKILNRSVIYRPPTLVIGIGLHKNTTIYTIKENLKKCLKKYNLCEKSIVKFATIKKSYSVKGLLDLSKEMKIPIDYFKNDELVKISVPNPSKIVSTFEGTYSVSEAAALKSSGGNIIVEKQKFPPDLTLAITRIKN